MDRVYRNPRVPAAQREKIGGNARGVRVYPFFASGCLSILFRLQSMAPLKEGDNWQMWEFIPL